MVKIDKYLTHTGQYFAQDLDPFTDISTPASTTKVKCFAYYGEVGRLEGGAFGGMQAGPLELTQNVGWFVLLPPSMHTIKVGDRIDNIVDNHQVLVKPQGRVEQVMVYRHRKRGIEFVQVKLDDN